MTRIFHSGASPFYIFAVPETNIFKISVRSSRSSAYCSQPERKAFMGSAPGLAAGQSASQMRPIQSVPEIPTFALKLAPEPRIFTHKLAPEPKFSLCRGTYLHVLKFGVSAPGNIIHQWTMITLWSLIIYQVSVPTWIATASRWLEPFRSSSPWPRCSPSLSSSGWASRS